MPSPDVIDAFNAAHEAADYYVVAKPGYVAFSGETRRGYLQRQTTNDLDLLSRTQALPSLLTAATGRILEYFLLIDEGEAVGMLTQPGHGPGLAAYFQKRVFFNDKVTIEDRSAHWAQVELHGPPAGRVLTEIGISSIPNLDGVATGTLDGEQTAAIGISGYSANLAFLVLLPATVLEVLVERLAQLSIAPLDFPAREVLRIEAGLAGDPEFQNEYTPFELGLDRLVSPVKGCYTGQEVLARQVTYDKVVRQLVRIRASAPLEAGAAIYADGKTIGSITSSALSPRSGPVALGLVRKPHDRPGTSLAIQQNSRAESATVV
ncbi:MAG: glycine cleavage T C-terminal barrel domain-containing protein [Anaerolineales bacterium]